MAATTTGAFPAITAQAATVDIPGIGNFDVPDDFAPQVQQFNQAVKDFQASPGVQVGVNPSIGNENGFTLPGVFGHQQQQQTASQIALDAAATKVGAQYSWGASGPYSFDCSGLVQWAYKQAGIELPRTSFEQSHVGAPVAYENLQPGDIVVTNGGGHVGIYAGGGQLLNSVQTGTPVSYTHLNPDSIVTARRVA